jgi:dynein heavy chain, axonemal
VFFVGEKEPEDFTPMAEYEMWLDGESEFNKLLEQLRTPFVEKIIGM